MRRRDQAQHHELACQVGKYAKIDGSFSAVDGLLLDDLLGGVVAAEPHDDHHEDEQQDVGVTRIDTLAARHHRFAYLQELLGYPRIVELLPGCHGLGESDFHRVAVHEHGELYPFEDRFLFRCEVLALQAAQDLHESIAIELHRHTGRLDVDL